MIKKYEDLPREAQMMCSWLVRIGCYASEAEYIADYNEPPFRRSAVDLWAAHKAKFGEVRA